jgi:hypothetical protein
METRTNSDYVGQAFRQFGRDAGAYIGLMVLTGLLYFIFSLIPGLGNILSTVVCGPLLAGIFIFVRLRDADERPDFAKFFGVFSNRYYLSFIAQAIFVTLITILFISFIGMLFLGSQLENIVSAILQMQSGNERDVKLALDQMIGVGGNLVLAVIVGVIISFIISTLYFFAPLFVIIHDLNFWPAMEASRRFVSARFWKTLGLLGLLALLNAAGALFCCIGLLVSIPVTYMAMYNAFTDQIASEPTL